MKELSVIKSGPGNGQNNMALDEAIFLSHINGICALPTLRLYQWVSPCVTIGYFQKYKEFSVFNIPVIRRLTGGLSVVHNKDISYCFVANQNDWPYMYDQMKNYYMIHNAIKEGLGLRGIQTQFWDEKNIDKRDEDNISSKKIASNLTCVDTFFPYDLHANGKKTAGSSQRRRGKYLLVQGSIHIGGNYEFDSLFEALVSGFRKIFKTQINFRKPVNDEESLQNELSKNKYDSGQWNTKF
jgi:lipoyl(octanoyl) transferase